MVEGLYLESGKMSLSGNASNVSQEIYIYLDIIVLISDKICFEGLFSHYSLFSKPFTNKYYAFYIITEI